MKVVIILGLVAAISCELTSFFELKVSDLSHVQPKLADGRCCSGNPTHTPRGDLCPLDSVCNYYFRLCLKEFQRTANLDFRNCTLGNVTSEIVAGFGSKLNQHDEDVSLVIPIYIRWTETFTLVLDVLHRDSTIQDRNNDPLIDRVSLSHNVTSTTGWYPVALKHSKGVKDTANLAYSVRLRCADNHYTGTCHKTCYPRDFRFGHWKCDGNGDKECLHGWMGDQCEHAVCGNGCLHGSCEKPGECRCREGWKGLKCDECVPYPGCKHGLCDSGKPTTCVCLKNWGGHLCDQDLDYCGRNKPCKNGGICRNVSPNEYRCGCPKDMFFGRNCELDSSMKHKYHPCEENVCRNGGVCEEINNRTDFHCSCAAGWKGEICTQNIKECASSPCLNGGSCYDQIGGYKCSCPPGLTGNTCQVDIDECELNPCHNAVGCRNTLGGYACNCSVGWEGQNCTRNVNDCHKFKCLNGGQCVDRLNGYECDCPKGFTGKQCETSDSNCGIACRNGGQCIKADGRYQCMCPRGYSGASCQLQASVEDCSLNPCRNGGKCLTSGTGYFCHCREGFFGKDCEKAHDGANLDFDSCAVAVTNRSTKSVQVISSKICGRHGKCLSEMNGNFRCECDYGYAGEFCNENINNCRSQMCQNGGTCIDGVGSFECLCKDGFTGGLCEEQVDNCVSEPCHNGGICNNLEADFSCSCKPPFKGKSCNLTASHCDEFTCENGGTCQDQSSFFCICPEDFVGTSCQTRKHESCESSPCLNGATCVNRADNQYECHCPEGFEGPLCETNIDDCVHSTCFNNGTCIDGVNMFTCGCAPGFVGADCRLNVDECSSKPCAQGSTCMDLVNDFYCVCPPGRTGKTCNVLLVNSDPHSSCIYGGVAYPDGARWDQGCSRCRCEGAEVTCDRGVCRVDECDLSKPLLSCPVQHRCVSTLYEECFFLPCRPHSECRPQIVAAVPHTSTCTPGQNTDGCPGRLTLTFTRGPKQVLRTGFTVEAICSHVKRIHPSHDIAISCTPKKGTTNVLEVLLSSMKLDHNEYEYFSVSSAAKYISQVISERRSNSTVLNSVEEVKIETLYSHSAGPNYLFFICISMLIILLLFVVLLLAYKLLVRSHPLKSTPSSSGWISDPMFPPSELNNHVKRGSLQKMNNLDKESSMKTATLQVEKQCNLARGTILAESSGVLGTKVVALPVQIPEVPSQNHLTRNLYPEGSKGKGNCKSLDGVVWC